MKKPMRPKKQSKSKNQINTMTDVVSALQTQLENQAMATRVSQMLIKQLLTQMGELRQDLDNTMGILNDFQYRTQAMLKFGSFDVAQLDEYASELKLQDYMKASDAEDASKGFTNDDNGVVTEQSIVIITSSTNGNEDKGIFRSKFNMNECTTDSLREKLLGSKVGDSFEEEINGDLHKITVVGLRSVENQQVEESNQ